MVADGTPAKPTGPIDMAPKAQPRKLFEAAKMPVWSPLEEMPDLELSIYKTPVYDFVFNMMSEDENMDIHSAVERQHSATYWAY